jgi:hypothetical protein
MLHKILFWHDLRHCYDLKHCYDNLIEKVLMKIAWSLPRRLALWCAIRVMAHATTGKYSKQVVPELLAMEALKRWDQ